MRGYLRKKGVLNPAYQKRWFELESNMFMWFAKEGDAKPKGMLKLSSKDTGKISDRSVHSHTFQIVTAERTYELRADTPAEMEEWLKHIQMVTAPVSLLDWSGQLSQHTHIPDEEIQVGAFINAGTSGSVYKGMWKEQPVALKRLNVPSDSRTKDRAIVSLIKELDLLRDLQDSSYILRYYGLAEQPVKQTVTIVTELCGSDIAQQLPAIKSSLNAKAGNDRILFYRIMSELVDGIAFLHSKGIVHRDIKPENCLLTDSLCVRIADFGLSTAAESAKDSGMTLKIGNEPVNSLFICVQITAIENAVCPV
jgi:hypothetical protein